MGSLNTKTRHANNIVLDTLDLDAKKLAPMRNELATSTNLSGAIYLPSSMKSAVKKRHKSLNTSIFFAQKKSNAVKNADLVSRRVTLNDQLETAF